MKYFFNILFLINITLVSFAQSSSDFETILKVKSSPLKDQQSSGTCWSFATTSFIETEAIRLGKASISLSPIFYVPPTYLAKAKKFIDKKGDSYFAEGDLTFSVLDAYKKNGAIPEQIYNGIIEDDWQHDHVEMDDLLKKMVESIGTSGYGRIKPNSWSKAMEGVLKAYLAIPPATFVYKDKLYSPKTFADEYVGINPEEYIEITSYTQSDFYKMFTLKIPANWNENKYLNMPIQEFEKTIDYALENGFSLAWDGDATEPFFDFEKGVLQLPVDEESIKITQNLRQKTFEDKMTTDDHNMHLIGKAKNKEGKVFYILKNSEGNNEMGGYVYMSKNAMLLKTISLLVHKNGIPTDIKIKSNLK